MREYIKEIATMSVGLAMLVYVWLCLVGANPI